MSCATVQIPAAVTGFERQRGACVSDSAATAVVAQLVDARRASTDTLAIEPTGNMYSSSSLSLVAMRNFGRAQLNATELRDGLWPHERAKCCHGATLRHAACVSDTSRTKEKEVTMGTLSTTAWVLRDLGLAAGFGGNLFGQLRLNPALKAIQSKAQHAKPTTATDWLKVANIAALTAIAGTWLIGRPSLTEWNSGRDARKLTLLKDGLVIGTVVTGAGAAVAEFLLEGTSGPRKWTAVGDAPVASAPRAADRLQHIAKFLRRANLLLQASAVAVSALLALQAGTPHQRLLTRFSP